MFKSNSRLQTIRKIYSYNHRKNISQEINKLINKKEKTLLQKELPNKTSTIENNVTIEDESMSTLRKYIKSLKPFLVSKSIRKKLNDLKTIQKEDLDNFYSSSVKTSSARLQRKLLFKNNNYNSLDISKNKNIIIENKNDTNEIGYRTYYNNNKIKKIYRNRNLSESQKFNFSSLNSKNDYKSNYSTMPTAAFTSRNFYKKHNYLNFLFDDKNDYNDALGYKNSNVKEPTYSNIGTIRSFMKEVGNHRKDNYINYFLKLSELKNNLYFENYLSQIEIDKNTKNFAKYLLDLYTQSFSVYWIQLKKRINKEYDINDSLRYQIKNLKIQINKLTNKIQKKLIKLNIFVEIRDFLVELKQFSSYPFGTSYKILSEVKNQLMEKIKNNEIQTNLNIYLLNNKDIGIDLFINKYRNSSLTNSNNNNSNKNIFRNINEFIQVPEKLDDNIKNLLWKQNILERDIDILKTELTETYEDSKNEQLYQDKIIYQYNKLMKNISHLKTENEKLKYKVNLVKKRNKMEQYRQINKDIIFKIMDIYNNLKNNDYINNEDNYRLSKIFYYDTIKYLMGCLSITEKNIIKLLKFKKEVINPNPVLKKQFELNCKIDTLIRRKNKEELDELDRKKKTIEKLNKNKYINEKTDYYYLNRAKSLNKNKRISKEKEKTKNKMKTSIEIIMDIIK